MRNINRIEPFCSQFAKIWTENFPDQRFGQLISNFFGWIYAEKHVDIWFPEESRMIELFKEYATSTKEKKDE